MTQRRRHPRIPLIEFEAGNEPILPLEKFWGRFLRGVVAGVALIGGSLMVGVLGYHWIGQLGWVDSILNASMILTGMGPVDRMTSEAAKLFASAYALFSGVMFLTSVGVLFAPVIHRFMHRFKIDEGDGGSP
jgi:hypothetical protein